MARFVGVPRGIACLMVLDGRISDKDILAPMKWSLAEPILESKEKLGVEKMEKILKVSVCIFSCELCSTEDDQEQEGRVEVLWSYLASRLRQRTPHRYTPREWAHKVVLVFLTCAKHCMCRDLYHQRNTPRIDQRLLSTLPKGLGRCALPPSLVFLPFRLLVALVVHHSTTSRWITSFVFERCSIPLLVFSINCVHHLAGLPLLQGPILPPSFLFSIPFPGDFYIYHLCQPTLIPFL